MNKLASVPKISRDGISPAEWQARVDLAAVYRLTAHYGWDDVIYNHSSMRVPDEPRKLLMKKHDLLYTEVTASNLVKVSMDEDLDEKSGVNRPGFTLHGGVLSARPDVNCAMHVHTNVGMAIAGLKSGLRMVSQQAIRFYKRIGYHAYEGITEDFDERERLNRDLGQNRAMIMHNHGLLTVGKSAREAFVLMKHLIDAADIQLRRLRDPLHFRDEGRRRSRQWRSDQPQHGNQRACSPEKYLSHESFSASPSSIFCFIRRMKRSATGFAKPPARKASAHCSSVSCFS